jgi:hypothetical protein
MARLEARIGKLEAAHPTGSALSCAVVRYNPGSAADWLPQMIADLDWPPSLHTLVTIDASAGVGETPEIVVPPLPLDKMSVEQSGIVQRAGAGPGPWWIAITARGWSEAMPMHEGETAMLRQLQAARLSERGHTGGL